MNRFADDYTCSKCGLSPEHCDTLGCKKGTSVTPIGGKTTLPIPVEVILNNAPRNLADVLVIGEHEDGNLYIASSTSDKGHCVWLIEKAKMSLLEQ